ncbi:NAD(P)/FAD-dependent oxidoreductase [Deinococcus sp.]|uniref:flavin monoamine oxidase family protein n=1 Tax=Deinococcus sp. TaxID=47478 RepID=UPI002869E567|nr:NAD(P)/FAD-dependent oxidoreductase [Deinococcus sp.]
MTRTPMLGHLLRALHLARHAEASGVSTAEALERREAAVSRRDVLRASGVVAGGLALAACGQTPTATLTAQAATSTSSEPVAIIGGGVAGLTVAYRLHRAGIPYRVYEASERVGGRMKTLRGHFGKPVELGGEFIDTTHRNIRRLASELKLDLVDLAQVDVGLIPQWYDIGGRRYTEREAVDAFRPLARCIDDDLASLGADTVSYHNPEAGRRLDQLSVRAYLEMIGTTGWLLDLLDVAYNIEYGLDCAEQSSLNFLYLVGNKPGQFKLFGYSDERYGIVGGNDRLPAALAAIVGANIQTGTWLEAASMRRDGRYTLTVNRGGTRSTVIAPRVVFALPFTTLRNVDLSGLPLPAVKRRAINELGYGTNSKLIAGFTSRIWRERYGSSGETFTDQFWQNTWESSRGAPGAGGCLTNYLGGHHGLAVGIGTAQAQTDAWLAGMERVFPGLNATRSSEAPVRAFWPGNPYVLASYSCYTVGQWTTISGAEPEQVGGLHWCGEHTSVDAQGYMEGGVVSGERVATELVTQLTGTKTQRSAPALA